MLSRFVQQFKNPLWKVLFLEVAMSILVGMNLDDCFFEEGVDFFLGEHVREGDGLPFRPDGVESCQEGCGVVNLFHICVSPFLNQSIMYLYGLFKLDLSQSFILSILLFFFELINKCIHIFLHTRWFHWRLYIENDKALGFFGSWLHQSWGDFDWRWHCYFCWCWGWRLSICCWRLNRRGRRVFYWSLSWRRFRCRRVNLSPRMTIDVYVFGCTVYIVMQMVRSWVMRMSDDASFFDFFNVKYLIMRLFLKF